MNVKLRKKLIICMGRTAIYAIVVCCSLTMAIAGESSAQRKSLSEITLDINYQGSNLIELLETIEASSDFAFAYSKREMKDKSVSIEPGEKDMDDILRQISIQAKISLKRVNETITIKEASNQDNLPEVTEVIAIEIVVSGTITNDEGEPLPGASVLEKGTTNGTITDVNGNFELSAQPDGVLLISFIGFTSEEVAIKNRTNIDVSLVPDIQSLQELVVVGYGTQKKSDLTGSVASVTVEEIKAVPVVSVDQALQGRVAGVQVTQTSSAPGGGVSIRVRGSSTLQGGNEPLYVIDGFPVYSNNDQASPGGVRGGTVAANALASLNPSDIESIEILKDASATAIYGSRGANGVVMITTKRGKSGKPQVNFETYYGTQQLDKKYDVMTPEEFVNYANTFAANRGEPEYFPGTPASYAANATDWQDEIFRTAPIQNYQLGISGGSDNTRYNISGNYFDQQGIIERSGFDRYSFRVNLDTDINERLKVGNSLSITRSRYNLIPSEGDQGRNTGAVLGAIFMDPTLPIFRDGGPFYTTNGNDSELPGGSGLYNPVALVNEVDDETVSTRILGNIFADYAITDHLSFRASFGVDQDNRDRDQYYTRYTRIGRDGPNSLALISDTKSFSLLNEYIAKYNNTYNDIHQIDVTAGYTWQSQNFSNGSVSSTNFVSDDTRTANIAAGANPGIPQSFESEWFLESWLGRVNYVLNDKYLFTITGRADGSSKFGEGNKWGFFPSGAIGWRLGEEDFIQNMGVFSDLKLRASYGVTGNQEIGVYQSLAALGVVNYNFNNTVVTGQARSRLANPDLKWERTAQLDIGMDASFLQNRINFTADYYDKQTSDLLLQVTLPYTSGFGSILKNSGEVQNRGIELSLGAKLLTGEFTWTTNANWSANRNEVVSLGESSEFFVDAALVGQGGVNGSIVREGEPLGSFYGYKFGGIFQNEAQIAESAQPEALVGDAIIQDISDDGAINNDDQTIIGNPNPDFIFGWTNNFTFKNFDLSFFLTGVQGNDVVNLNNWESANPNNIRGNKAASLLDAWTPENTDSDIPKVGGNGYGNRFVDKRMVEDGSFIRLRTLTLGYNLPTNDLNMGWLRNARIYFTAQNLFTITDYSGFNPEVNTQGSSSVSYGYDAGGYPLAKTFLVGINLGL